jgi:hypothetical protein
MSKVCNAAIRGEGKCQPQIEACRDTGVATPGLAQDCPTLLKSFAIGAAMTSVVAQQGIF